jgi:drug/metabolite transporter (DMT)-like permease
MATRGVLYETGDFLDAQHHASRTTAMGLALAGFALLSVGDAVIKSMAGAWPGPAVAALRFSIGALGLACVLWLREGRSGFACPMPRIQFARGLAIAFASTMFFLAIFVMPLAEATAIQFVSPLLAALFSALILRERAPRAIWIASALAFSGVLVVLRPNVATVGLAGLLPLFSAAAFAMMMVLNRKVSGGGSVIAMQFLISAMAAPILIVAATVGHLSGATAFHVGLPDWTIVVRCAVVALTATCSHSLIYMATVRASAGAVAPMTYVQLLVAMLLGTLLYGDRPDLSSLGGAALIVAGGLYLWRRSAVR